MNSYIFLSNVLSLGLFALIYQLLCRKEKVLKLNRVFLLTTVVLSIIIPFLHLEVIPVYLESSGNESLPVVTESESGTVARQQSSYYTIIYLLGLLASFLFFLYKLSNVFRVINTNSFQRTKEGVWVTRDNQLASGSFFHWIILGLDADENVYSHELSHVRNNHSWDILWMEILAIILWFNPFIYVYRYLIKENHEFTADLDSVKTLNVSPIDYSENILRSLKQRKNNRLMNTFSSLIKRRILFLNHPKKKNIMKYLLVLPLIAIVFFSFTLEEKVILFESPAKGRLDTLPENITLVDTIIYYDADNYTETVTKVLKDVNLEEYMSSLTLSGEMITTVDTVTFFDYDNMKESIKVNDISIPKEVIHVFKQLYYPAQLEFARKYGKVSTKVLKE